MAKIPIDFKLPALTHKNNWVLTSIEKEALDASIFMRKTQGELYVSFIDRYCTPKLASTRAAQLFSRPDAKDYLETRKKQIELLWFGADHEDVKIVSKEDRINKALEVMRENLLTKVQDINDSNWLEYARMVLKEYVKDDELSIESPRRYLSEDCNGCRYKHFCEENTGDECPYCKYKKYALEHGCEEFTYKNQLEK